MPGTVIAFDKQTGIWVKTGSGILCITKLQRQGKNAMGYKDFMNKTMARVDALSKKYNNFALNFKIERNDLYY